MDVMLEPGEGHDFHRHPGQEEMIIVKQGDVTQFLEQRVDACSGPATRSSSTAGIVHASFNDGDETALSRS